MLAERANKSFDSLARLIHDTGVACNLPAYPIDSKWTFTYEPYSTGDESGLAAETLNLLYSNSVFSGLRGFPHSHVSVRVLPVGISVSH